MKGMHKSAGPKVCESPCFFYHYSLSGNASEISYTTTNASSRPSLSLRHSHVPSPTVSFSPGLFVRRVFCSLIAAAVTLRHCIYICVYRYVPHTKIRDECKTSDVGNFRPRRHIIIRWTPYTDFTSRRLYLLPYLPSYPSADSTRHTDVGKCSVVRATRRRMTAKIYSITVATDDLRV